MSDMTFPRPRITDVDRPFWDSTAEHEFRVQECDDCRTVRWPPSPLCPECWSEAATWIELSGYGTINTWAVYHDRVHEAFVDDVPYVVAEVELDRDIRYLTNMVGCDTDDLYRGMPVSVVYDEVAPDLTLPKFKPRK